MTLEQKGNSNTWFTTQSLCTQAFLAAGPKPPGRSHWASDSAQVTGVTASVFPNLSLSVSVFFVPGKYSRLKATGWFFCLFCFFTYHSRNSYWVIFVRVTVVYAYLLFTDCRILPITSLVGTDNTEIHAFMWDHNQWCLYCIKHIHFFLTPSSKINSFKFVVKIFVSTITHKITCKQFDITLMYKWTTSESRRGNSVGAT